MNLRKQISALLLIISITSMSIIAFFGYFQSRDLATEAIFSLGEGMSEKHALSIDGFFKIQLQIIEEIADYIEFEGSLDQEFLSAYLIHKTNTNKASAVYYFGPAVRGQENFVSGTGWIAGDDYDWTSREWFIEAKSKASTIMTSPYIDVSLGGLVVTIAKPIYINNSFVGVLGTDISIETVIDAVENAELREGIYAFLIDHEGYLVSHPNKDFITEDKIYNVSEILDGDLGEIVTTSAANIKVTKDYDEKDKLFIGTRLSSNEWQFLIAADQEILLSTVAGVRNTSLLILLIVVVLVFVAAFIFAKILTKPINQINDHAELLASLNIREDLPKDILNRKDEIGKLANSFQIVINNLRTFIKSVGETSQEVASFSQQLTATSQQSSMAADEIARTIEEIAKSANEQAADTEGGVVKANELSTIIEEDLKDMKQVTQAMKKLTDLKDEGIKTIKGLIDKTQNSNDAIGTIYKSTLNTNESAERISEASKLIEGIAEQTNLLALNAAIEAARAGEAGRGFAVVAEEIRKLAEQSKHSVHEINTMLESLQNNSQNAVGIMQNVLAIIKEQVESVSMTGDKFDGIANEVETVKTIINKSTSSVETMSRKKEELAAIMENLAAIAEENAAGTEEASSSVEEQTASMEEIANASETLATLAEKMQEGIAKFKY